MAVAQMNWGRMRFPLTDPRMSEFAASLAEVYRLAETHPSFVWRIPDDEAVSQLEALGKDNRISSTVSVWETVDALREYTFESLHGQYLNRTNEWFETVSGPQLVIWDVESAHRPTFKEAFDRLAILSRDGPTVEAYGWPS